MKVYLRISKMCNNHISFSVFKHTGEIFRYKYIEDGCTFKNEYNICNSIIQLMPKNKKSSWLNNWYEITNYQEGFFTKLAKYISDSINPYKYFIEEIEKLNSLQSDKIQAIKI